MAHGVKTFKLIADITFAFPIGASAASENNIVDFLLDDTDDSTDDSVSLKVTSSATYTLIFTFTGSTKIESNSFRTIGLLAATVTHTSNIIIDSAPVFGILAIFAEYTSSSGIDITANAITVNSEPLFTAKSSII